MKLIQKVDLIGNRIGFKIENSFYFKSVFGGTLTIILAMVSISTLVNFGLPLFTRTNPKVTSTNSYEELPYINLTTNFPLAVNVVKRGAIPLENFESYYNITMISYNTKMNDGLPKVTLTPINMRICKEEDFQGRLSQFNKIANPVNFSQYFCLPSNQNLEIYGVIGTTNVNYLALLINKCTNGSQIICKKDEEITSQFQNLFIQYISSDYYFDSKNNTLPGQIYFKSTNIPITSDFYKRTYFYYQNVEYSTDGGYIFESEEKLNYYHLDSYKEQIFFTKSAAFTPYTLSEITITLNPIKTVYFRSYYKLQQLAADMGGIIKAILIVFNFVNSIVGKFNLQKKTLNDLKLENVLPAKINHNKSIEKISINKNITISPIINRKPNLDIYAYSKSINFKKAKSNKVFKNTNCVIKNFNSALDIRMYIYLLNEFHHMKNILLDSPQLIIFNQLCLRNFLMRINEIDLDKDEKENIKNIEILERRLNEVDQKILIEFKNL
jgi:hypothetical protein